MLKLRKGCKVPFPEKLQEGYTRNGRQITANVSADKIAQIMMHFIKLHDEPMFFILEIPSNLKDEAEIANVRHKDIYYIDGCSADEALNILHQIGELVINDGMSAFGFGGHRSQDEIMFDKYNVTTLFSREPSKFDGFFEEHDIPRADHLITAWDTFSQDHPGECQIVTTDGQDIYSIPERYGGMYKAEQREC